MASVFGHCAQQVCLSLASEVGISEAQAVGMASTLGCGYGSGDTCGCYTAGLLLIGLRYDSCQFAESRDRQELLVKKVNEFERRFKALQPQLQCRDIIGIDVTKGDGMQKAMASGRIEQICHPLIEETVRLLDQMFAEDKRYEGNCCLVSQI